MAPKKQRVRRTGRVATKRYSKNQNTLQSLADRQVKTWHALTAIAFIGGMFTALIWSASMRIGNYSNAASRVPKTDNSQPTYIAKPMAGEAKDHILVKFNKKADKEKKDVALKRNNMSVKSSIKQIGVDLVTIDPNETPQAAVDKLKKNEKDLIDFAEVDGLMAPLMVPNDPSLSSQWFHNKLQDTLAWDNSNGSSVSVGILDSGVDPTHPDLAGHLVPGYNFIMGNTDTHDVYGHGTKVAGSAAAIGNNTVGVAGVAWNANIVPLVVADSTGYATWSALSSASTWAADHGIRIINMSFGATTGSSTLQNAINYAWNKGVVIIAGAGNSSNSTPNYPAAYPNVIGVTATTSSDTLAGFSSYGNWVDLAAPGASILTTSNGGGYSSVNGTSFSGPITAGVVALMLSKNPALTNAQVEQILKENADDLGTSGFDQYYGYGRVNANKSVLAAINAQPFVDTAAPTAAISSPVAGATVSGTIAISATASDNAGVTKVEFYKNGALAGTDTSSPYSYAWDTTKDINGAYALTAKAYDAAGNVGTSSAVTVNVANAAPAPDLIAPTVTITLPADGATTIKNTKVSAKATDNQAVTSLRAMLDGAQVCSVVGKSAFICSISNRKYASGMHTITVEAADAAGNKGTAAVSVIFQ